MDHASSAPDGPAETWPYTAHIPQRYTVNRDRYIARGGMVRLEDDVRGFVQGGRNTGDMARFYFFCLVLDQLCKEGLVGDIVELGVYKGDTASLLANVARRLGKVAWLLDTFEGFSTNDIRGIDAGIKMEFADTSIEAVRALVGDSSVKYIKGYFPETASQLVDNNQYCLVHIDCDLYAPMISSLSYFYPRLVEGGYLLMHDYTSLHWGGAERAIDEFFADKVESVIALPDGAGTAVVRKAKAPDKFRNWYARRRSDLLGGQWVDVSTRGFEELLGSGWSQIEPWGVWGVGDAHVIQVILPSVQAQSLEIEAEVNAVLLGSRTAQQVDIVAGGQVVETWSFTRDNNLAVRRVTIPVSPSAAGVPNFSFEFRPHSIASPRELDPSTSDERALGLGLHRIRFTVLD